MASDPALEEIKRTIQRWSSDQIVRLEAVNLLLGAMTEANLRDAMAILPAELFTAIKEEIALRPQTNAEWDALRLVIIGGIFSLKPMTPEQRREIYGPRPPSPEERQRMKKETELLRRYFAEQGVDLARVKAEVESRPTGSV